MISTAQRGGTLIFSYLYIGLARFYRVENIEFQYIFFTFFYFIYFLFFFFWGGGGGRWGILRK